MLTSLGGEYWLCPANLVHPLGRRSEIIPLHTKSITSLSIPLIHYNQLRWHLFVNFDICHLIWLNCQYFPTVQRISSLSLGTEYTAWLCRQIFAAQTTHKMTVHSDKVLIITGILLFIMNKFSKCHLPFTKCFTQWARLCVNCSFLPLFFSRHSLFCEGFTVALSILTISTVTLYLCIVTTALWIFRLTELIVTPDAN